MANLTFLKDASIFRIDVDPLSGTFVTGEFFVDTVDPTKLAEVISFTDDLDGTGSLDYILIGTSATQFVATDTFTGDGNGTGTVNSTPAVVGTHHVHVVQVDIPDTVVFVQDLINDIRDYEEELINLDHPKMINASGKQDLGGGVLVGITLEMLDNWRIQFEPRTGPLLESVSITGGNIVATNDYNDNPIKASPFTQVSVQSSSSATIIEEVSKFEGRVTIDVDNGVSGVEFPIGTTTNPVNNITDARSIADTNNLKMYECKGTIVLNADHDDWGFVANATSQATVNPNGFSTDNSVWDRVKFSGNCNGTSTITVRNSSINGTNLLGTFIDSGFSGTNTFAAGVSHIVRGCTEGTNVITFNVNGTGRDILFSGWSGECTIQNLTGSSDVFKMDLNSASVTLESSCTDGAFTISGQGIFTDDSAGTTVNKNGLIGQIIQDNNNDPGMFV